VIVTGAITFDNIAGFLREFYHPRRGRILVDVVILSTKNPSNRLQNLLQNVQFARRTTTFLKGNVFHEKDAERAHVFEADAVFILADRKSHNSLSQDKEDDAWTIFTSASIGSILFT
jgi:hypothetical protein